MFESLSEAYIGDLWWIGWVIMPFGGFATISWIITYIRRNGA